RTIPEEGGKEKGGLARRSAHTASGIGTRRRAWYPLGRFTPIADQEVSPLDFDTDLGGPAAAFPATRCTLIRAAASADPVVRRQAPAAAVDPDDFFRREWVRELFAAAVDDLRRECAASAKELHFKLFERYDLDGPDAAQKPSYATLAQEFGLPQTQVTNYLAS